MPIYHFEGMDASGSEVKDRIDAASAADAQRQLSARGYFVARLREVGAGPVASQADAERREVVSQADSTRLAVSQPLPDETGASPADDSVTLRDPALELRECGWIAEPTDTGGVRLRAMPQMRWVMSGCMVGMLLPLSLFAMYMYHIAVNIGTGSPDWFLRVGMTLIQLVNFGVIGLVIAGIVTQILWLLFVREEWEASHNSLEIRKRLLGFAWERMYRDGELLLDPHYDRNKVKPLWQLAVKCDGRKHYLIRQGALSTQGTAIFHPQKVGVDAVAALLSQYTGWSVIAANVEATQTARSALPQMGLPAELQKQGFRSDVDEQFRLTIRRRGLWPALFGIGFVAIGCGALYFLSSWVTLYVDDPHTAQDGFLFRLFFWLLTTLLLLAGVGVLLLGIVLLFGREQWILGRNRLIVRSRLLGWTADRDYVDAAMMVTRVVSTGGDRLWCRWQLQLQNQAGKNLKELHSDPDDDGPRLLGALLSEHTGWPLRDGLSGESPIRSPALL